MKIQWWQNGVHAEPESAKERDLLLKVTELLDVAQLDHGVKGGPIVTVQTGDQQAII